MSTRMSSLQGYLMWRETAGPSSVQQDPNIGVAIELLLRRALPSTEPHIHLFAIIPLKAFSSTRGHLSVSLLLARLSLSTRVPTPHPDRVITLIILTTPLMSSTPSKPSLDLAPSNTITIRVLRRRRRSEFFSGVVVRDMKRLQAKRRAMTP